MSEKQAEKPDPNRQIILRWKVMLALGVILIALGLFVVWPPQDTDLPNASSFLIILGGLLGAAGLLVALRHG